MRIHLGHHFYGAGNLGDDFMLAGFLGAMHSLAPDATYSACVPFPLEPLRQRFPEVEWQPCDESTRAAHIARCDVWLGLGGSPFQSAQSRWFIDHLLGEEALCRRFAKRMFFLGVGVQTEADLAVADVRALCQGASAIWTRDAASARRLASVSTANTVHQAADFAHLCFQSCPPPPVEAGTLTLVSNFDYGSWTAEVDALRAIEDLQPKRRVWLAQESRPLPGAELDLYSKLPVMAKRQWELVVPDVPGAPLSDIMKRWPSGEWLVTSRYHAAMAGAWAGSRILVVATNEKLRSAATEMGLASVAPDAPRETIKALLTGARPAAQPVALAARALAACCEFVTAARSS